MATKNNKYWRERFEALEQAGYRQGSDIVKQAERIYSVADKELQMEIMLWYQRIAENNGVSMSEARKMLSDEELEEFKWSVEDYIEYGEKNGVSGDWSKELENASAKAHINRLTAMRMSARNAVENLSGKLEKTVTNGLGEVYKESAYRTGYEIQKGKGEFEPFGRINENQLSEALKKPWTADGKTFADRLNRDKKKLVNAVDETITKGIIKGSTIDEMTAELSKRTTESLRSARTIIRTETSSIAIRGELAAYSNLDVEKIEISETLDSTTCPQCGSLDGKVIAIKDARVGENVPPFHPRCRGCTVPYFDDDFFPDTTRAARNPETGKTEYVEHMNYSQWKKKWVDEKGEDWFKAQQNKSQNTDRDTEQFERYKKVLGKYSPKTLAEFKKIKYNNSSGWGTLKHNYRIVNSYEDNSGKMDKKKLLELDDFAFNTKRKKFTGKAKREANIAVMELDGDIKIGNSRLKNKKDPAYINYKGDKAQLVFKTDKPIFKTFVVGNHDRDVDSEAKLFEYATNIVNDGKKHTINLLSEKCMCDSCLDVMRQFKEKYPNVTVNAVSNKKERNAKNKGKPWKHRG